MIDYQKKYYKYKIKYHIYNLKILSDYHNKIDRIPSNIPSNIYIKTLHPLKQLGYCLIQHQLKRTVL